MTGRRLLEILAIAMIGEGIAGLIRPRRYTLLWSFGPEGYRRVLEGFANRPELTRFLCLAELGLGLWLTLRETRADPR